MQANTCISQEDRWKGSRNPNAMDILSGMMHHGASPTTSQNSTLPDIISDSFLATLRQHGVQRAYLFGSFVRNEERPGSDLDLLVEFATPTTLFDQLRLAERLEHLCGHRVDLTTEIHPAFAPYIEPTLVALPL